MGANTLTELVSKRATNTEPDACAVKTSIISTNNVPDSLANFHTNFGTYRGAIQFAINCTLEYPNPHTFNHSYT